MPDNKVVSHGEWLKARLELLAAEKELVVFQIWTCIDKVWHSDSCS
jgi:hypothetical protein